MKNELVVKDNALINASYNLELAEQRLILLAIVNSRETQQGITSESKLEIYASDYAKHFNVTKEAAYDALKNAVNNLFNRQFSFKEKSKKGNGIVRSRWVSRIKYIDDSGTLEVTFAPDVVPLITRLEERFTSYQLKQVAQLTSKYAMRLYELLVAWREVGKIPKIDLAAFRNKIGVEDDEYQRMHHFKIRVLEPAIDQINKYTDITVSYEQHKKGRVITGFSFTFSKKAKEEQSEHETIDTFYPMTEAEINSFGNQLARLPKLSVLAHGNESYDSLALRIKQMLRDETEQKQFIPHLKKLGFVFRKERI